MKTNAHPYLTRLSSASMMAAAIIGFIAVTPCRAEQVRVYTNADLDALPAPQNRTETAQPAAAQKGKAKPAAAKANWKEPIPTQAAPVATTKPAEWDEILAFIERERAAEARRTEAAQRSTRPESLADCFYGDCSYSVYRPGYLEYPGLITRRHCLPCDLR